MLICKWLSRPHSWSSCRIRCLRPFQFPNTYHTWMDAAWIVVTMSHALLNFDNSCTWIELNTWSFRFDVVPLKFGWSDAMSWSGRFTKVETSSSTWECMSVLQHEIVKFHFSCQCKDFGACVVWRALVYILSTNHWVFIVNNLRDCLNRSYAIRL